MCPAYYNFLTIAGDLYKRSSLVSILIAHLGPNNVFPKHFFQTLLIYGPLMEDMTFHTRKEQAKLLYIYF
jgi:hypothetical protein